MTYRMIKGSVVSRGSFSSLLNISSVSSQPTLSNGVLPK